MAIVRDIMPQLLKQETYRINIANLKSGCFLFALGLLKKTFLADTIGSWVDAGFSHTSQLSSVETLVLVYLFGLQIYFDFSAYSDMALGLARLFNINFPVNFNSPYKNTSIIQFWQQWNITLTHFITSYVYIPLVRLKKDFSFAYSLFATFIAMTVIGIWHGSSWNYVLFGMLQGVALVINHLWRKARIPTNKHLGHFITLNFWLLAEVLFRSATVSQALDIYRQIFAWSHDWLLHKDNFITDSSNFYWLWVPPAAKDFFTTALIMISLIAGYLICLLCNNAVYIAGHKSTDQYFWIKCGAAMTLGVLMLSENSPFIYFQF